MTNSRLSSPRKKKLATETDYSNAGIMKLMVIALVQRLPERPENMEKMMGLLDIEEFTYYFVGDLKVQNLIVGMQAHSCSCPCIYCFGMRYLYEDETLRKFKKMRELATAFIHAKKSAQIPKNFKNCVRLPLLKVEDEDKEVLDVIPPSELHIMLGIVNKLIFTANERAGSNLVSITLCPMIMCVGSYC